MPVVQSDLVWTLAVVLSVIALVVLGLKLFVRRWKANLAVTDDTDYVKILATLSEAPCDATSIRT